MPFRPLSFLPTFHLSVRSISCALRFHCVLILVNSAVHVFVLHVVFVVCAVDVDVARLEVVAELVVIHVTIVAVLADFVVAAVFIVIITVAFVVLLVVVVRVSVVAVFLATAVRVAVPVWCRKETTGSFVLRHESGPILTGDA